MASKSVENAEAAVARQEERLRQAKARLRAAKSAEGSRERKARNRVLYRIGGMLAGQVGGVENVDLAALQRYLDAHAEKAREAYGRAGYADAFEADEARRAYVESLRGRGE